LVGGDGDGCLQGHGGAGGLGDDLAGGGDGCGDCFVREGHWQQAGFRVADGVFCGHFADFGWVDMRVEPSFRFAQGEKIHLHGAGFRVLVESPQSNGQSVRDIVKLFESLNKEEERKKQESAVSFVHRVMEQKRVKLTVR